MNLYPSETLLTPIKGDPGSVALQYPFVTSYQPFVFSDRETRFLSSIEETEIKNTAQNHSHFIKSLANILNEPSRRTQSRVAVLACGSNASPQRLATKYRDYPNIAKSKIPVLTCRLNNYASVYMPTYSPYSSIPATLTYDPGYECPAFIMFLLPDQLQRMNATETLGHAYSLSTIRSESVLLGDHYYQEQVCGYFTLKGVLRPDDHYCYLKEYADPNTPHSYTQREVQDLCMTLLTLRMTPEEVIAQHLDNDDLRVERSQHLYDLAAVDVKI